MLYLGGNCVLEVPSTVGQLTALTALVLSDNQLEGLPPSIANLKNLRSLMLHRNQLRTLPQEIVALKGLSEVSAKLSLQSMPPCIITYACVCVCAVDITLSRHASADILQYRACC